MGAGGGDQVGTHDDLPPKGPLWAQRRLGSVGADPRQVYVEVGSGYNKIVGGGSLHRMPMGQNGRPENPPAAARLLNTRSGSSPLTSTKERL